MTFIKKLLFDTDVMSYETNFSFCCHNYEYDNCPEFFRIYQGEDLSLKTYELLNLKIISIKNDEYLRHYGGVHFKIWNFSIEHIYVRFYFKTYETSTILSLNFLYFNDTFDEQLVAAIKCDSVVIFNRGAVNMSIREDIIAQINKLLPKLEFIRLDTFSNIHLYKAQPKVLTKCAIKR